MARELNILLNKSQARVDGITYELKANLGISIEEQGSLNDHWDIISSLFREGDVLLKNRHIAWERKVTIDPETLLVQGIGHYENILIERFKSDIEGHINLFRNKDFNEVIKPGETQKTFEINI